MSYVGFGLPDCDRRRFCDGALLRAGPSPSPVSSAVCARTSDLRARGSQATARAAPPIHVIEIDVHGQKIKPPVTESTRFPNASANTGNNARWRRSIRSKFLDVIRRATCCHHLVSRNRCGSRFGKPQPGRRGARARKCGALWEPEELLPFESTTRKGGLWPRSVSTLRGTC